MGLVIAVLAAALFGYFVGVIVGMKVQFSDSGVSCAHGRTNQRRIGKAPRRPPRLRRLPQIRRGYTRRHAPGPETVLDPRPWSIENPMGDKRRVQKVRPAPTQILPPEPGRLVRTPREGGYWPLARREDH